MYCTTHTHKKQQHEIILCIMTNFFAEVNKRDFRAWYGLGQTYEIMRMPFYCVYYYRQAQQLRYVHIQINPQAWAWTQKITFCSRGDTQWVISFPETKDNPVCLHPCPN